jgi:lipoprotein signal peptidase
MKMKDKKKEKKLIIIFIMVLIIIDQLNKWICIKQGLNIVQDELDTSNNGYYIVMSIIIVLMIIRYISNDNTFIKMGTKIVLSFGIAGCIGNAIDRIILKQITVFIKLGNSFYTNLAYIYILIAWVGMAGILAKNSAVFLKEKRENKNKK